MLAASRWPGWCRCRSRRARTAGTPARSPGSRGCAGRRRDSGTCCVGHQVSSAFTSESSWSATGVSVACRLPVPQPVLEPVEPGEVGTAHARWRRRGRRSRCRSRRRRSRRRRASRTAGARSASRASRRPGCPRGPSASRVFVSAASTLIAASSIGTYFLAYGISRVVRDRLHRRHAGRVPADGDRRAQLRAVVLERALQRVLARAEVDGDRVGGTGAGVRRPRRRRRRWPG